VLPSENFSPDFEIISKENKIKLDKFENLKYENQNFYMAEIPSKADSNYTISYQGIDIKGLVLKVGVVNNSDLAMIEDMVVNLIQVSDENIKDSEARAIYTKILSNLGEKELSSLLTYTNGIIYGIRIDPATGELIFFARESEDEKAVTSIPKLNFIKFHFI